LNLLWAEVDNTQPASLQVIPVALGKSVKFRCYEWQCDDELEWEEEGG
jgi:hypothetical protein